jgi:hypothetical protein
VQLAYSIIERSKRYVPTIKDFEFTDGKKGIGVMSEWPFEPFIIGNDH